MGAAKAAHNSHVVKHLWQNFRGGELKSKQRFICFNKSRRVLKNN